MVAANVVGDLGAFLRAGGTKEIGALVFWSLSGVNIPRDEFRKAFEAHGMGAAVPRAPRHATCLTTAVTGAMVGKKDVFARRLEHNGWGLVVEHHDRDNNELAHKHVATVELEGLKNIRLKWKFQGKPEQLAKLSVVKPDIEARYETARTHLDTSDLSSILVNLMHGTARETLLGAVSLRERTGGLYFVHARRLEDLALVKNTVERLAPKCSITVLTISGSADNLAAAAAAARQSFEGQLKELRDELVQFKAQLGNKGATEHNITVRANRYDQLNARVELFRDVLGDVALELEMSIASAKAELVKELETA
jgi:hypothetical protein